MYQLGSFVEMKKKSLMLVSSVRKKKANKLEVIRLGADIKIPLRQLLTM